ncbi:NAD-dependent epimerase/dehydratase family protein [Pseudalkalibacillus sp. NRS-1564]|uniref:NAD-dependent epimerase/dehydratase family protein n=1 Tax=Pseudalkalibacillus sp. NRS-1564 TaxID=3233900 RepID=UPI003D2A910F
MKKAFITGALGFIGFHLTEFLLGKGIEVVAIDNKLNTLRNAEYEMKEMMLLRNANYKQINSSLSEASLTQISEECDTIFHLSHPGFEHVRGTKMIEEGLQNTSKVLQASNGKVLVYLSSTEVFGTRYGQITEKTPLHPTTMSGKLNAEDEQVLLKSDQRDCVVKVLRAPLVYGPWQPTQYVYQHYFLTKKLPSSYENEGKKFHHDAVYVRDVCWALYQAGCRIDQSESFNLTSGREGEWQTGVEWCIEDPKEMRYQSNLKCRVSSKECANKLGFKNVTPIDEGLQLQLLHTEKMMAIDPSIYLTD